MTSEHLQGGDLVSAVQPYDKVHGIRGSDPVCRRQESTVVRFILGSLDTVKQCVGRPRAEGQTARSLNS